jgi:hypothetical protein
MVKRDSLLQRTRLHCSSLIPLYSVCPCLTGIVSLGFWMAVSHIFIKLVLLLSKHSGLMHFAFMSSYDANLFVMPIQRIKKAVVCYIWLNELWHMFPLLCDIHSWSWLLFLAFLPIPSLPTGNGAMIPFVNNNSSPSTPRDPVFGGVGRTNGRSPGSTAPPMSAVGPPSAPKPSVTISNGRDPRRAKRWNWH